jgi:hypothetical protein
MVPLCILSRYLHGGHEKIHAKLYGYFSGQVSYMLRLSILRIKELPILYCLCSLKILLVLSILIVALFFSMCVLQ